MRGQKRSSPGGAQLDFGFRTPSRRRKRRRGRPRNRNRVPHGRREVHEHLPLHVTMKMRREVWNLRSRRCYRVLERAFYRALGRGDSRVAHFSVQGNHIHILVEASDRLALGKMIHAMAISMARQLNRVMNARRGPVFADRYHARCLRTPTETRAALLYVLQNARKHLAQRGHRLSATWTDQEFSSAPWFAGWLEPGPPPARPPPTTDPETWLLDKGWHTHGGGFFSRTEVPATA